jgi:hypothetical protein
MSQKIENNEKKGGFWKGFSGVILIFIFIMITGHDKKQDNGYSDTEENYNFSINDEMLNCISKTLNDKNITTDKELSYLTKKCLEHK